MRACHCRPLLLVAGLAVLGVACGGGGGGDGGGGGGEDPSTLTVSSFSPASGPEGTAVTLNGTAFAAPLTVSFGGTTATTVTIVSSTELTAVVPVGAASGAITVETSGGRASGGVFQVTRAEPTSLVRSPCLRSGCMAGYPRGASPASSNLHGVILGGGDGVVSGVTVSCKLLGTGDREYQAVSSADGSWEITALGKTDDPFDLRGTAAGYHLAPLQYGGMPDSYEHRLASVPTTIVTGLPVPNLSSTSFEKQGDEYLYTFEVEGGGDAPLVLVLFWDNRYGTRREEHAVTSGTVTVKTAVYEMFNVYLKAQRGGAANYATMSYASGAACSGATVNPIAIR